MGELEAEVEYTVGAQEEDKTTEGVHKELEKALAGRLSSKLPEALIIESAKQRFAVMLAEMRSNGTPDEQLKQMVSEEGFQKYVKVVRPRVEVELRAGWRSSPSRRRRASPPTRRPSTSRWSSSRGSTSSRRRTRAPRSTRTRRARRSRRS